MELACSKSSRWIFVGRSFHCMMTAAPRHRKICSSSLVRGASSLLSSCGAPFGARPFRHDALEAHLAGVPEYGLAIVAEVLGQTQPGKAPGSRSATRKILH